MITEFIPRRRYCAFVLLLALFSSGCGGRNTVSHAIRSAPPRKNLPSMRYSIQVGAFENLDNAVRLNEALERRGLNAYYFVHGTGLYKVRFGDFASKDRARRKAEFVRAAGIIDEYYIVSPEDYAATRSRKHGANYLRDEIVRTAERFIGVPYRWGGSSVEAGFDCSGLTMTVYRLNGLNLPRVSREQYKTGTPIARSQLSRGDLVFFATSGGKRVSHVGIYVGKGKFIHAPKKGRKIRAESLSKSYFRSHYLGARTYLN